MGRRKIYDMLLDRVLTVKVGENEYQDLKRLATMLEATSVTNYLRKLILDDLEENKGRLSGLDQYLNRMDGLPEMAKRGPEKGNRRPGDSGRLNIEEYPTGGAFSPPHTARAVEHEKEVKALRAKEKEDSVKTSVELPPDGDVKLPFE